MSEAKHATYGPSSLKYREICPGWRNDRDADLTFANEGTSMHEAAETGRRGTLTDDQWAEVQKCLRYIKPLERGATAVHKELRLEILNGLTFGTADRVIIRERKAVLVDFKFGRGAIDDAEINRQGMAYVIGVFEAFDVDEVEVHFISPRRDEVTTHIFKRDDLERLRVIINRIIRLCEEFERSQDESLLNPHDGACQYCGFIARCPKHRNHALDVAKKYAPLELVDETHSSQISDPEQMARAYAMAKVLEKWAASVKKHATEMAMNGIPIPGWEVRERAGNREIASPVLAYQVLIDAGLEPIDIVAAASLSLSKLEQIVSNKAPRGQKSASVAALNAALAAADAVTTGDSIRYLTRVRE